MLVLLSPLRNICEELSRINYLLSNDVFDLVVDQSQVVVDLSLKTQTNKRQELSLCTVFIAYKI